MTPRQRGWLLPPLAVFLAGGILLGRAAQSPWAGLAACLPALSAVLLSRGRVRFLALLALGLAVGCLRGYFAYHPPLPPEETFEVTGIIAAEVEHRENHQVRTALTRTALNGKPFRGDLYWSFYSEELPEGLRPGQQVRFTGQLYHPSGAENPDGYDFREEMLRRGILAGIYGVENLTVSPPDSFSLRGWAAALRHLGTEALLASPLGEEAGGYAAALLLGNRSFVPREDRTAFSRLGIAHILAVSGFHVGVLAGVLALLFRLLRLPQGLRLWLYAVLLGAYVLLCGSAQPVLRAAILLLLARRGRMLNRPRSLLHLLCAAFCLQLLLSPVQLTGLSFQLSFGAVFGLALISPYLSSLFSFRSRRLRRLQETLAAGVGAQLGVLLPQLYAFQELPLLSLLLNLPVLLYASGLILLCWLCLLTLPLPFLSVPLCTLTRTATSGLLAAVRFLGSLPGIRLWTCAAGLWTAAGLLLVTCGLCALFRWKGRTRLLLAGVGGIVMALSLMPWPHAGTEYYQFSVGDADAGLLWDRDTVLVMDTGYEDGVLSDFLHRRRLTPTAVVLTHLHTDHVLGLRALREDGIPVPLLYLPEGAEQADVHPDALALLDLMRREGTEIRTLAAGEELPLPSGRMEILWPRAGQVRPGQDANESCLVSRLTLKGVSLLHTGDLDGRYEMYAAAPSDVLKAAHHGSAHSSSAEFLAAVSPRLALLSCGRPARHQQFRERLDPAVPLLSTAVGGMLTLRFAEGACRAECFLPAPTDLMEVTHP